MLVSKKKVASYIHYFSTEAMVDRLLLAIEIVHSLQYNESISNQDMQLCMNDFVQMYTDCGVSRNPSKQAEKHYGQHT